MAGKLIAPKALARDDFAALLADVKGRIQTAQTRAVLAVNAELVRLYWDIGRIIHGRQEREGWGAAVIPRLARELHNELPDLKGFSERNIKRMLAFYRAYPTPEPIGPQTAAQRSAQSKVPQPAAQIRDALLWSIRTDARPAAEPEIGPADGGRNRGRARACLAGRQAEAREAVSAEVRRVLWKAATCLRPPVRQTGQGVGRQVAANVKELGFTST